MNSININKFLINKTSDVYSQSEELTGFLDKYVKEKNLQRIISTLSKKMQIPLDVIEYEAKQYLVKHHNFIKGQFDEQFKFKRIFQSSIVFFLTLIYVLIFSKRRKNYSCEIIFDEITSIEQAEQISELKEKFNSYKMISSLKLNNNLDYYIFSKQKGVLRKYILFNFNYFTFNCLFNAIRFSLLDRTNYIPLVLHILKQILKYESIFQQIKAKFLFQVRHYNTSAIKDFLFKKYGGKKTCCAQKNIIHLGRTGFYIHTDIFFTLGNKTSLTINFCGSRVKKVIPVGSIFLKSKWLAPEKIEVPKYDLINLGGNSLPLFSTDKNYLKNYYEHFNWLLKLSKEFPKLKIAVKHHENNNEIDKKEIDILKKGNIERIVASASSLKNYSYGYAFTAKFTCTWASTMGYELIGHSKPCYFLDPNGENTVFLHKEKYNNMWRLKSYDEFKEKVINTINVKDKYIVENKEDFCLDSKDVFTKIFNNLVNLA